MPFRFARETGISNTEVNSLEMEEKHKVCYNRLKDMILTPKANS